MFHIIMSVYLHFDKFTAANLRLRGACVEGLDSLRKFTKSDLRRRPAT
jgi:hypothetical protein